MEETIWNEAPEFTTHALVGDESTEWFQNIWDNKWYHYKDDDWKRVHIPTGVIANMVRHPFTILDSLPTKKPEPATTEEHTGLSVSYYDVVIKAGTHTNPEHNIDVDCTVSCNDIIELLDMNYAQANVLKAQWRIAAAKQGKLKKGNNTFYDAEKSAFFSGRVLVQEKSDVK